jgi:hypothetical protein
MHGWALRYPYKLSSATTSDGVFDIEKMASSVCIAS